MVSHSEGSRIFGRWRLWNVGVLRQVRSELVLGGCTASTSCTSLRPGSRGVLLLRTVHILLLWDLWHLCFLLFLWCLSCLHIFLLLLLLIFLLFFLNDFLADLLGSLWGDLVLDHVCHLRRCSHFLSYLAFFALLFLHSLNLTFCCIGIFGLLVVVCRESSALAEMSTDPRRVDHPEGIQRPDWQSLADFGAN